MLFRIIALSGLTMFASLHAAEHVRPYQLESCTERIVTTSSGESYRIMVSVPEEEPPAGGFPVAYVLDGDGLFPVVTSLLRLQAGTSKASKHNGITPGIVVGIGYPEESRRNYDYTLPSSEGPPETYRDGRPYPPRPGGGADEFFQFLEKELKPLIEKEYSIDRGRQVLVGNGYGGLFALHVLFTQPDAFQTYVAASPSIWWNNRYVLEEEKAFLEKYAGKSVKARLFLTVGGQEQSLTRIEASWDEDAREEHRLKITRRAMVDHTRELYWRLQDGDIAELEVDLRIFEGESHKSATPLSLNAALPVIFPAE